MSIQIKKLWYLTKTKRINTKRTTTKAKLFVKEYKWKVIFKKPHNSVRQYLYLILISSQIKKQYLSEILVSWTKFFFRSRISFHRRWTSLGKTANGRQLIIVSCINVQRLDWLIGGDRISLPVPHWAHPLFHGLGNSRARLIRLP